MLLGPNLNLLGQRERRLYGDASYAELVDELERFARAKSFELRLLQSNHEGELVTAVQESIENDCGLVVNFGAYTHTSLALADALACVSQPVVECHLTNLFARPGRARSLTAEHCDGVVMGLGPSVFRHALTVTLDLVGAECSGKAAPERLAGIA